MHALKLRAKRLNHIGNIGELSASGKSEAASPQFDFGLKMNSQPLNLLCCNIRSILGKSDQLVYLLNHLRIHFVLLQET